MQMNTLAATGLDWTSGPLETGQLCLASPPRDEPTHRPRSHAELASIAPNREYTIMPFQYGKGDLVTWARMSCET